MSTAVAPLTREQILKGPDLTYQVKRKAVIYSVYPAELPVIELSWFAGFYPYHIAPADRDGYTKLEVVPTVQWVRDTSTINDENHNGDMRPAPIDHVMRAHDLANKWRGNTVGAKSGFSPGIAVYDGEEGTPQFDKFISDLRTSQQSFFQWLVQDANDKHIKGDNKDITDLHRSAAKWLLESGAERLPWYPKIEKKTLKRCMACDEQIADNAKTCTHCRTDLIEWMVKYDLEESADPTVFPIAQKIKKARAVAQNVPIEPQFPASPKK